MARVVAFEGDMERRAHATFIIKGRHISRQVRQNCMRNLPGSRVGSGLLPGHSGRIAPSHGIACRDLRKPAIQLSTCHVYLFPQSLGEADGVGVPFTALAADQCAARWWRAPTMTRPLLPRSTRLPHPRCLNVYGCLQVLNNVIMSGNHNGRPAVVVGSPLNCSGGLIYTPPAGPPSRLRLCRSTPVAAHHRRQQAMARCIPTNPNTEPTMTLRRIAVLVLGGSFALLASYPIIPRPTPR